MSYKMEISLPTELWELVKLFFLSNQFVYFVFKELKESIHSNQLHLQSVLIESTMKPQQILASTCVNVQCLRPGR